MNFDKDIFSLAVTLSAPIVAKYSNTDPALGKLDLPIFGIVLEAYDQLQKAHDLLAKGLPPKD